MLSMQSTHSSQFLPTELYRPIVSHVQNNMDLLALCCTSRTLFSETMPVLYRCVECKGKRNALSFFQTLKKHPGLASFVKEFTMTLHLWLNNEETNLIRYGLHRMTLLDKLSIMDYYAGPAVHFLDNGPWSLQSLRLQYVKSSSELETLLQFLAHQHNLTELDLAIFSGAVSSFSVPPSTCPQLSILSGNRAVIEAFLPTRPIKSLTWIPDFEESFDELEHISAPLSQLHTLSIGARRQRPRLSLMAPYLSLIQSLELEYIWSDEINCLNKLLNLRCLILSNWGSRMKIMTPVSSRRAVVDQIFHLCTNLQVVYIELPSCSNSRDGCGRYQRWRRNAKDSTLLLRKRRRSSDSSHRNVGKDFELLPCDF